MKRTPISTYRMQRRGGTGRTGMKTREEDFVEHLFIASTHAYILIFTNKGRVYWLKVYEIPDVSAAGKGKHIGNLVGLQPGETVDHGRGAQSRRRTQVRILRDAQRAVEKNPNFVSSCMCVPKQFFFFFFFFFFLCMPSTRYDVLLGIETAVGLSADPAEMAESSVIFSLAKDKGDPAVSDSGSKNAARIQMGDSCGCRPCGLDAQRYRL